MQHVHIMRGEDAAKLAKPVEGLDAAVTVVYLPNSLDSGRAAVLLSVADPDTGKVAEIVLTARNLMNIAGGIRGWMIDEGLIPVKMNPGMAMSTEKGSGVVHFALEAPLQSWDYDTAEAKKLWRELRRIAEESSK